MNSLVGGRFSVIRRVADSYRLNAHPPLEGLGSIFEDLDLEWEAIGQNSIPADSGRGIMGVCP